MLSDKERLLLIVAKAQDRVLTGAEADRLRDAVQRLDELDDLVDAVCTCRTQEIPVIRAGRLYLNDDVAPGRP